MPPVHFASDCIAYHSNCVSRPVVLPMQANRGGATVWGRPDFFQILNFFALSHHTVSQSLRQWCCPILSNWPHVFLTEIINSVTHNIYLIILCHSPFFFPDWKHITKCLPDCLTDFTFRPDLMLVWVLVVLVSFIILLIMVRVVGYTGYQREF